jgi:hypothetical protein
MIKAEGNKLIIEIRTNAPEVLAYDLIKDIPVVLQALQCLDREYTNEDLPGSVHTLLELYSALLPSDEQEVAEYLKLGKQTI